MSARPPRRRLPAQRKPAVQPALVEQRTVADAAQSDDPEANDFERGVEQLLQQFESVLREDPGIDAETRDLIRAQFGQALADAATTPDMLAAVPDRESWMDAVRGLRESGAVDETEANDLVRQLDQALQPLQRRESQLAIEFSRRLQAEGQEKALAWFRQQTAEDNHEAATPPPARENAAPLRNEVINSRSRRLRGPPRQR